MINPSSLDYGFPSFLKMPQIEAIGAKIDDPIEPHEAKEAGEGTQLSPAPAIVNAVYDAFGVDIMKLHLITEKINAAQNQKKTEGATNS